MHPSFKITTLRLMTMKNFDSSDFLAKSARFQELCISIGFISEGIQLETRESIIPDEVELAESFFSELRSDFGARHYNWPGKIESLVANDYFSMTQLAERIGAENIQCKIDKEGRVFSLTLKQGPAAIEEISLLNELQELTIEKYGEADPSSLVNCPKLTTLRLKGVNSHMQTLESMMAQMSWLESVEVRGSQSMNLDWVSNHKELVELRVPRLGIERLTPLRDCVNLKFLDISHNPVSSLEALNTLRDLRTLLIIGTNIPDFSSLNHFTSPCQITISHYMAHRPGFRDFQLGMFSCGGLVKVSDSEL